MPINNLNMRRAVRCVKEMRMYEISGYTDGRASAWSFRWHHACKPGRYVVHVKIGSVFHDERAEDSRFGCLADAVIDDFGNLVRVQ